MESLCLQILGTEVRAMTRDPIWQAFSETGDPLYYLLYCFVERTSDYTDGGEEKASQSAAVAS